jgi:hypothetical protein
MKNLTIFLLVILLSGPLMAQEETLFSGEIESGWYGGPLSAVGQIIDETGFLVGVQGGWIINHRFVLGGKGYILVNPVDVEGLQNIVVGFGCGGALFEYIIASNKLLHFNIENMIGIGGVYNDVKVNKKYHDPIDYTGDACLVLEPGLNLMLNVIKNFRIGVGATYRYVYGIDYDPGAPYRNIIGNDYENISDSDLSGVTVQIILKFGAF